jgi:hypothetical protein
MVPWLWLAGEWSWRGAISSEKLAMVLGSFDEVGGRVLRLRACEVEDDHLAIVLNETAKIEVLEIDADALTPLGMVDIVQGGVARHVKEVVFYIKRNYYDLLEPLLDTPFLAGLEVLHIPGVSISWETLLRLFTTGGAHQLRSLDLTDMELIQSFDEDAWDFDAFMHTNGVPQLQELRLGGFPFREDELWFLIGMPCWQTIKSLYLVSCSLTESELTFLKAQGERLVQLHLANNLFGYEGIVSLLQDGPWKQLEVLDVSGAGNVGLGMFWGNQTIEHVNSSLFAGAALRALATSEQLPSLVDVRLNDAWFSLERQNNFEQLLSTDNFLRLQHLEIARSDVSRESFENLSVLISEGNLEYLDVSGNEITDAAIQGFVKNFKKGRLKTLILQENHITNKGLQILAASNQTKSHLHLHAL